MSIGASRNRIMMVTKNRLTPSVVANTRKPGAESEAESEDFLPAHLRDPMVLLAGCRWSCRGICPSVVPNVSH